MMTMFELKIDEHIFCPVLLTTDSFLSSVSGLRTKFVIEGFRSTASISQSFVVYICCAQQVRSGLMCEGCRE